MQRGGFMFLNNENELLIFHRSNNPSFVLTAYKCSDTSSTIDGGWHEKHMLRGLARRHMFLSYDTVRLFDERV